MPTEPLTPADLRPGQRVRITKRHTLLDCAMTWEGNVQRADTNCVALHGLGAFIISPHGGWTQTIEVIE